MPSSNAPSSASAYWLAFARAKAEGVTLGRPALEDSDADKFAAIKVALAEQIAREFQTGVGTVLRIKAIWLSNTP